MYPTVSVIEQDRSEPSCNSEMSSDSDSIFERHRTGGGCIVSAFRLYSSDVSYEEDDSSSCSPLSRSRGSYRKYTQVEKEMAVQKVPPPLFRSSTDTMSNRSPRSMEFPGGT